MRALPITAAGLMGLACLAGCAKTSPEDEKLASRLVGTWFRQLPVGAAEGGEQTVEFKPDGTCITRVGASEQAGKWRIENGKLVLGKNPPQTIHELTDTNLAFGDGDVRTQLLRRQPPTLKPPSARSR